MLPIPDNAMMDICSISMELMGDKRYEKRKQETKDKLKSSFFDLCMERKCLVNKAMDVCREAGVARSTFYTHYECYEDFLKEIVDELLLETEKMFSRLGLLNDRGSYNENFDNDYFYYRAMEASLDYFTENRKYYLPFVYPGEYPYFSEGFRKLILRSTALTTGHLNNPNKAESAISQWLSLAVTSTLFLWITDPNMDKTQLMDIASRVRKIFSEKI